MADLISSLLELPAFCTSQPGSRDYDASAKDFVKSLSKIPESAWAKAAGEQQTTDLLNPSENSLAYAFALHAQCTASQQNPSSVDETLTRATLFSASFDPVQIRYAGTAFRQIMEWMLQALSKTEFPDFSPVTGAMLRLDPSGSTFTSTHLSVVQQCLASGVPTQALPILDRNIHAFPQRTGKNLPEENLSDEHGLSNNFVTADSGFSLPIRSEHVLEYHLLGAQIYIGLRNFSRARLFLEHIILAPSSQHTHSALQIEAYKKWVLMGLIANGTQYPLPRTFDQQIMKSLRAASKPYDTLAEDFERRKWRKYQADVDIGREIWHEDGNSRLVKETTDALLRFWVADLQNTYAAIPVSRVASHLEFSPDDTYRLLQELIRTGQLNASISPASSGASTDAVLRFHTNASIDARSRVSGNDTEALTDRIQELVTFVRDADRRLRLTKEYFEHQRRQKRGGPGPDGDPTDPMDLTWDGLQDLGDDGDEDLMGQ